MSLEDDVYNGLIRNLESEEQQVRINAIQELGNSGDELSLKLLREKLKLLTPEHQALIIAIGKLKSRLGLK